MDRESARRMRMNLLKGTMWVVGGLAVVLVLDQLGAGPFLRAQADDGLGRGKVEAGDGFQRPGLLAAFAFEDDEGAVGSLQGVPEGFVAECFSPAMVGVARYSAEGPVVGISSELPPDEAFGLCAESMQAHGWLRTDSGWPLRASFVKAGGRYRWAYLDVSQVLGSGSVVVVLKGEE